MDVVVRLEIPSFVSVALGAASEAGSGNGCNALLTVDISLLEPEERVSTEGSIDRSIRYCDMKFFASRLDYKRLDKEPL